MAIKDPVSVSEAARVLKLSSARVRVMASRGQIPAVKIGDRWLLERGAVEQRRRSGALNGRRFTRRNAWGLLAMASGEDPSGLDPSVRSRLKRALLLEGLLALAPRLADRAEVMTYRAHPGEIKHLLHDEALVRSGISAAGPLKLDLLPGREVDGYIATSGLKGFVAEHALSPAEGDGNVRLRVVPGDIWRSLAKASIAPAAAVALDLLDEADPRSHKAGRNLAREIDRNYRARAKAGR